MTYLDYNDGRGPVPLPKSLMQDALVDQLVRKHGWRYRIRDVNQTVVERGK